MPPHIAARASGSVGSTRRPTVSPSSTSAGNPVTACPAWVTVTVSGIVPNVHDVAPCTSATGEAVASASRTRSASRRRRAVRSLLQASGRPASSTARYVTRRWSGTDARSRWWGATGGPAALGQRRREHLQQRAVVGTDACASTSAATSPAGVWRRRRSFGSVRRSAVTSSSRRPGTCHSRPARSDGVEERERARRPRRRRGPTSGRARR